MDLSYLIGKEFKYKGKYGLSEWTDIVSSIEVMHGITFDKLFNFKIPKKGEDFKAEKLKIIGFKYSLYVRATRTNNVYEFENCIFLEDDREN
jgi:hypothetical protein